MISVLLWIAMQGVPIPMCGGNPPMPCLSVTATTTTAAPVRICRDDADEDCVHVLDIPQPPEPMDVPAVELKASTCIGITPKEKPVYQFNDARGHVMMRVYKNGCSEMNYHTYSCADKSRILLTSENGVRHCVKF